MHIVVINMQQFHPMLCKHTLQWRYRVNHGVLVIEMVKLDPLQHIFEINALGKKNCLRAHDFSQASNEVVQRWNMIEHGGCRNEIWF